MEKTRELIERVIKESNNRMTEDGLAAIAEQGVTYIVYSSLTDPGNEAQIVEQLRESRRGTYTPLLLSTDAKIFSPDF